MAKLFDEEPTVVIDRARSYKTTLTPREIKFEVRDIDHCLNNLTAYSNPLLNAASELLGILVALPRQGTAGDVERFRQNLLDQILIFKERATLLDYHPNVIEKTCFVICAAFDEAILFSMWGEQTRWENRSLLSKVFSQRNGGEIFFQLLDRACQQPAKLVDFIELQYVLLMLGFQGKYRNNDTNTLHEIKSDVYGMIRNYKKEEPKPIAQTLNLPNGIRPWHMISATKTLVIAATVLGLFYLGSEYWYNNRTQPLLEQFQILNNNTANLSN